MPEQIEIRMGAMAPSLVEQLVPYGVSIGTATRLENLNKAITGLCLGDLLPDAQAKKCRDKLFKQIEKELQRAGAQP